MDRDREFAIREEALYARLRLERGWYYDPPRTNGNNATNAQTSEKKQDEEKTTNDETTDHRAAPCGTTERQGERGLARYSPCSTSRAKASG